MKPTNNTIPGAHLPTKAVLRPLEAPVVPHASHFLSTIFPRSLTDHLPFQVPTNSILSTVGGTPISEIQPGLWAKLEGFNFSGSIKDRAVLCTVLKMIEQGTLKSGSTLVLITSGSAGVSLGMIQKALAEDCGFDLRTIVMMPKAYQKKAAVNKMVENGVPIVYDQMDANLSSQLLLMDGVFMEVMQNGKELAGQNGFSILDQHYDMNGMLAHKTTAIELLEQMPGLTDVVCATGTGATAAGLRAFLPDHISVHSRASESGKIDGLSDVNRYDNFCNTAMLQGYDGDFFKAENAIEQQQILKDEHRLDCGMSTGATMWLAQEVKKQKPSAKVAFIAACGQPVY